MNGSNRVRVPEGDSQRFTEIAIGVRAAALAFEYAPRPQLGSAFAQTEELYPFESLADRAREYVRAALEHLLWWADWVAPLKFHPEQETTFTLRPAYTLGRASLESAAQAVWMLESPTPRECIRRHVCLMRWDLQEHRKSKLAAKDKEVIKQREAELVERVGGVFTDGDVRAPDGYLAVIRAAAATTGISLQPDDAERLWRAASGVAHGKFWPIADLQRTTETEGPDGLPTGGEIVVPDTTAMADLVGAAYRMTQFAVLRFADYCGGDLVEIYARAIADVAKALPIREGVSPVWTEGLSAEVRSHLRG